MAKKKKPPLLSKKQTKKNHAKKKQAKKKQVKKTKTAPAKSRSKKSGRAAARTDKVKFTGNAMEYFGIWIANLVLSIITLGIFSAWAKVRRERYFKSHTEIMGDGFGYHATGWKILKGRLLVFAVFVVLNIAAIYSPTIYAGILVGLLFAIPWVVNSALRFSARMTSFRNVRFNWHGTYWKTFGFIILPPIIGVISLTLLVPVISRLYYRYYAESHSYGTARFKADLNLGQYYRAYFLGGILPAVIIGCMIFPIVYWGAGAIFGGEEQFFYAITSALLAVLYAFIFTMVFIYSILCRNLLMKGLSIRNVVRFDSSISPLRFVWISFSNLVAIIFTLGFLLPWAAVRMHRYLAGATTVHLKGNVNKFIGDSAKSRSAFGEEFAEFEGFEWGF